MKKAASVSELFSKSKFILSILSVVVLMIGLVFKFSHWPGALFLIVSSLILIAILLIESAISQLIKKFVAQKVFYPVLGAVFSLGVLFKIMHWPMANMMIMFSMLCLSVAFAEFSFRIKKNILSIIPAFFSITLIMMLFKIMHWPYSTTLLTVSYLTFALFTPLLIILRSIKIKQNYPNIASKFLFIGLLSLFYLIIECCIILPFQSFIFDKFELRLTLLSALFLILLFILKYLKTNIVERKLEIEFKFLQALGGIYMIILVIQVLIVASF
jgi:hypothetical protein